MKTFTEYLLDSLNKELEEVKNYIVKYPNPAYHSRTANYGWHEDFAAEKAQNLLEQAIEQLTSHGTLSRNLYNQLASRIALGCVALNYFYNHMKLIQTPDFDRSNLKSELLKTSFYKLLIERYKNVLEGQFTKYH